MKTVLSIATRCCSAAFLCSLAAGSLAQPPGPVDRRGQTVIDSCVTAAQFMFKPGVTGIVLDARDSRDVAAEIVRRYPMIERDGWYPQSVALWRPPKGQWVYATLSQKSHAPHPVCFTAHVDAGSLDVTPVLIRKYFGPPAP